jgi:hypothetical protein
MAHPLVDYCSNVNFKEEHKQIDLNMNQYLTIGCRCSEPSRQDCSHAAIQSDENLLEHMEKYTLNPIN